MVKAIFNNRKTAPPHGSKEGKKGQNAQNLQINLQVCIFFCTFAPRFFVCVCATRMGTHVLRERKRQQKGLS